MTDTKSAKGSKARATTTEVWTDEERAAMQEHVKDMKKSARRGKATEADGEADLLEKVAEMPPSDRAMAERIHAIIKETAPDLESRTWYGMPAYARDGKVVCFFQPAIKFKARYATLGFNDAATLDDGSMWPTSWALTKLTPADEKQVAQLVKRAVG
jgi:uncharacterized protein YdhG (YjbR/CyaY superfamily)